MRILAEDTTCIIVDYQEKILPTIAKKEELIETSVKLLKGLNILGVPMHITGQYTKGLGLNISEICEAAGTEGQAKRGRLTTVHGVVETPVFMNVGTVAAIKGAVSTEDLM